MSAFHPKRTFGLRRSSTRLLAAKLELAVRHVAWELTGGEACMAALLRDARRLAGGGGRGAGGGANRRRGNARAR